jgi:hypothetical protein
VLVGLAAPFAYTVDAVNSSFTGRHRRRPGNHVTLPEALAQPVMRKRTGTGPVGCRSFISHYAESSKMLLAIAAVLPVLWLRGQGTAVPMGWFAGGYPAQLVAPGNGERIHSLMGPLDCAGTVFGLGEDANPRPGTHTTTRSTKIAAWKPVPVKVAGASYELAVRDAGGLCNEDVHDVDGRADRDESLSETRGRPQRLPLA